MYLPCMLAHPKAANRVFLWLKNHAERQTPTGTKATEVPSSRMSDEGGSPPMDYKLNKDLFHRAQCTEAVLYITLAGMYLSQLRVFSYDLCCESVRHFACACSCCDGKCIVQDAAERTYFFTISNFTPMRVEVSEACSCWFVTSWIRF